jgi:tetratricopeptide (TPR) repeat protein
MKKLLLSLTVALCLCGQVSQAQSREDFIEKLEAINMDDKKAQLALLDKAISAFPKDADLYLRRADLKTTMEDPFNRKDIYGFIADYTKAIENENVSWRYVSRANGKNLLENYKGALEDLNIAIKMAEKENAKEHLFSGYHARSQTYAFLNDYKNAIIDAEKSISYSYEPEGNFSAAILSSMADYAQAMKDYPTALKYIDRSIAMYKKLGDKTEATMYYVRALLQIEKMSKKAEGCADLKKASIIDPNDDMVKDAIKKHCK